MEVILMKVVISAFFAIYISKKVYNKVSTIETKKSLQKTK